MTWSILSGDTLTTVASLTNVSSLIPAGIHIWIAIALWICVIIWVVKDSQYRSFSLSFQILSIILVTIFTPLVGLPIYRAIMPYGDKYERKYWKDLVEDYMADEATVEEVDSPKWRKRKE